MAVEIKELVIRAVAVDSRKGKTSDNHIDYRHIIDKCVAEVLKILERKQAR